MSEILSGSKNVAADGIYDKYVQNVGKITVSSLKGTKNQLLVASRSIFKSGSSNLYVMLNGSTRYHINLLGTVGIELAWTLILSSDGVVKASTDVTRASNG